MFRGSSFGSSASADDPASRLQNEEKLVQVLNRGPVVVVLRQTAQLGERQQVADHAEADSRHRARGGGTARVVEDVDQRVDGGVVTDRANGGDQLTLNREGLGALELGDEGLDRVGVLEETEGRRRIASQILALALLDGVLLSQVENGR